MKEIFVMKKKIQINQQQQLTYKHSLHTVQFIKNKIK